MSTMHLIYGPAPKEPSDRDIENGLAARGKDESTPVVVLCKSGGGPPYLAVTYAGDDLLAERWEAIERYVTPAGHDLIDLVTVEQPRASLAVSAGVQVRP